MLKIFLWGRIRMNYNGIILNISFLSKVIIYLPDCSQNTPLQKLRCWENCTAILAGCYAISGPAGFAIYQVISILHSCTASSLYNGIKQCCGSRSASGSAWSRIILVILVTWIRIRSASGCASESVSGSAPESGSGSAFESASGSASESASGSASASNKNQDPDPHQSDKLDPEPDPEPHQFADEKPKRMEYEPI